MKLTLAVGILTPSFPLVATKTSGIDGKVMHQGPPPRQKVDYSSLDSSTSGNKVRAIERNHHQDVKYCDPSSDDPEVGVLSCGDGFFCNYDSNDLSTGGTCESKKKMTLLEKVATASRFHKRGILKNSKKVVDKTVLRSEECDPIASPDIGILACEDRGQTCVPHAESRMGGFCMSSTPSRQLYHLTETLSLFCDPMSEYYMYYDCDCTGFDNSTGTGRIPCTIMESYCIGILYPGCDGTCLTQTKNYSFTDFVATSYISCELLTGPYSQRICLEEFFETETCSLSINDQSCTSCSLSPAGNRSAITFDCTNVGGGIGTSNYILDVADVIYSCYTPLNFTCDICDGTLINPDAVASVYGYSHACSIFETGLNETLCSVAGPLLVSECCRVADEPASSPPESDEPDATPSEPVPSPGPGPEPSIPSAGRSNLPFTTSVRLSIGMAVAWLVTVSAN